MSGILESPILVSYCMLFIKSRIWEVPQVFSSNFWPRVVTFRIIKIPNSILFYNSHFSKLWSDSEELSSIFGDIFWSHCDSESQSREELREMGGILEYPFMIPYCMLSIKSCIWEVFKVSSSYFWPRFSAFRRIKIPNSTFFYDPYFLELWSDTEKLISIFSNIFLFRCNSQSESCENL